MSTYVPYYIIKIPLTNKFTCSQKIFKTLTNPLFFCSHFERQNRTKHFSIWFVRLRSPKMGSSYVHNVNDNR